MLPAHGHPFDDLAGRVEAIHDHHAERLEQAAQRRSELDGRPRSRTAATCFPRALVGPMADSETYAHLEHLTIAGEAERWDEGGFLRYRVG